MAAHSLGRVISQGLSDVDEVALERAYGPGYKDTISGFGQIFHFRDYRHTLGGAAIPVIYSERILAHL